MHEKSRFRVEFISDDTEMITLTCAAVLQMRKDDSSPRATTSGIGTGGLSCKRLTNTPVLQAESVLKCPDDRKNRVVSAQATYASGSSALGGRVCEQRYAAERVLPESRFELQHSGSPSEEAALEEKAQTNFFGRSFRAGGVGGQGIAEAARTELWAGRGAAGRAPDRGAS